MAIRKIAQIGHPVLRQVAREVRREELATPATQAFIDDLVETMHDADGAGLAAIQVYEPIQICAIEVRNNPRYPYKPQIPLDDPRQPGADAGQRRAVRQLRGLPLGAEPARRREAVRPSPRQGVGPRTATRSTRSFTGSRPARSSTRSITCTASCSSTAPIHRTFATWTEFERHQKPAFIEHVQALVARVGS